MLTAALLAAALLLDAAFGEPKLLWDRLPHPAVLLGRAVAWLDATLNRGGRRQVRGIVAVALLVAGAGGIGFGISVLPDAGVIEVLAAAILLAQRSLVEHVRAVAIALRRSAEDGRTAVARIVGRDTAGMDPPAIARAAIESAAENLSDGLVAPAFWFLVAGLPGIVIYKAVNTADSMIGHRTPRHAEFGWAAARLDDLLNWVPARLTAVLIAASHLRPGIHRVVLRDAPRHRSPNAGWPEAAMAAVLGIALSGPRSYGGTLRDEPVLNPDGRRDATADDIDRAVGGLWRAWALLLAIVLALAWAGR